MFGMLEKGEGTAVNAMNNILASVVKPFLINYKDYGKCTSARRTDFLQAVDIFINYSEGECNFQIKRQLHFNDCFLNFYRN